MRTDSDAIKDQYKAWPYPLPIPDLAVAVEEGLFEFGDPSLLRRKLWPKKVEPDDLDILIAGCGTNQAAHYAFKNPNCRVVGIDVSETSLEHQRYLKQKHGLQNLELHHLSLGQVASLQQSFDLVVSTGVLMILPDPDAGLRCLRDVLRPHGVMSLMLYGQYPRVGVYMLQEAFRLLGLEQDKSDIEAVRHALKIIPRRHHVHSYVRDAPDLDYDSGMVDTFLIRQDRAYTVPQILRFASDNGLKFPAWLDNVHYSISAFITQPDDIIRKKVEALPLSEQWQLVELMTQRLGTHRFLLCHPGRPEEDYSLDFTGDAWTDYVPSLRPPLNVVINQRFVSKSGLEPADTSVSFVRSSVRFDLKQFEALLLALIDGTRSVGDILRAEDLSAWNERTRTERARKFFRQMAEWDNLQYEIPG